MEFTANAERGIRRHRRAGRLGPQTRGRPGPARTAAPGQVGRQRVPDWKPRGYVQVGSLSRP